MSLWICMNNLFLVMSFFLLQNGLQALNYGSNSQAPFQVEYWILPGALLNNSFCKASWQWGGNIPECVLANLDYISYTSKIIQGGDFPDLSLSLQQWSPGLQHPNHQWVNHQPFQSNPCEPSWPVIQSKPSKLSASQPFKSNQSNAIKRVQTKPSLSQPSKSKQCNP